MIMFIGRVGNGKMKKWFWNESRGREKKLTAG
jgi:hypothetical protein